MLFVILICLIISLLGLEENLVGGHYCFPSGCLYSAWFKLRSPVQQVSIEIVALKLSLILPFSIR